MLEANHRQPLTARARSLADGVLAAWLPAGTREQVAGGRRRSRRPLSGWIVRAATLGLLLLAVGYELRTSTFQSYLLSRYAATLSYSIQPGASPRIAFPRFGTFDERWGYSRLPDFQQRLEAQGYRVVEQARQSRATIKALTWGITPPYREPTAAGLVIGGLEQATVYDARPRDGFFARFEDAPPMVVSALLFIENRELARATSPQSNPAVDWGRLAKAAMLYAGSKLGAPVQVEGGSTLAIQLDKYRHSANARTASPLDKLRQVTAASLKAYGDGRDTRDERRQIILDYLNSMPLAAAPGHGEIYGLGEGLRAWFGLELEPVSRALAAPAPSAAKARALKHVLALLCAVRAPTYYLVEDRSALAARLVSYTKFLMAAGVIDPELSRMLGRTRLEWNEGPWEGPAPAFVARKAANAVRDELRELLGVSDLYRLDRLHLEVESTIDGRLQEAATSLFRRLERPDFVEAKGLRADRMLSEGNPGRVAYSLLLFERTPEGNLLRVRADSLDRPFDMNEGMKLELGSTAKLRTLAHYLEVVAELRRELSALDGDALVRRANEARDPLTRWAATALRQDRGLDLDAFLGRALARTYPATPAEVFFTGGGVHMFHNFDADEDGLVLTVRDALVRSNNLIFVRVMRDLVRFHEARLSYDARAVLADPDHPDRRRLLGEVADEEGRRALVRAYREYRGLGAPDVLNRLLRDRAQSPRHLAIAFFAWHPGAGADALHRWLTTQLGEIPEDEARRLAQSYGNPRLTVLDHGYLLGRHPLEVWCAGELFRSREIAWKELVGRSAEPRRVASAWLLDTRHRRAQDLRLRIRIEQGAFARMTPAWRRLGFPFERLVPSYATAIGSSSDRPVALAELMGIIVNDGVRRPTRLITHLRFAPGTPYHTAFAPSPAEGERVLAPPVARALREVLAGVVETGTARRVKGVFVGTDGGPLAVGGKTGSGDNRFDTFARGGQLKSSRSVSRTSAFVFYIGDRYFGVLTASVTGPSAGSYQFTSALPQAVLRLLAPEINGRLGSPAPRQRAVIASR